MPTNPSSPTKPSTFEELLDELEYSSALNIYPDAPTRVAAREAVERRFAELEEENANLRMLFRCIEGGMPIVSRYTEEYRKLEAEIKARGEIYGAMCERLHECCQKYQLGLGGEHVDRLVIEEVDRLRANALTPKEAEEVLGMMPYKSWSMPVVLKLRSISSKREPE